MVFLKIMRNLSLGILVVSGQAKAIDKAAVLPKGVYHSSFRAGLISEIGERYGTGGTLNNLGDNLSKNFDLKEIMAVTSPEKRAKINDLVNTLNQFGESKIGDQVNLGTLRFSIDPSVQFYAPVLAYGLTERFTIGIAVPVVNFKSHVSVFQTSSNIPQIKAQVPGVDTKLTDGLNELNQNLVTAFGEALQTRGFKALHDHDDSYIGDIQLVGLYQVYKGHPFSTVLKGLIVLPTGPQDDPDDLGDLPALHQGALGLGVIQDYHIAPKWTVGAGFNYLMKIPDRIEKRVPLNGDDALPDISQKEMLNRDLGDTATASINARVELTDSLEAGVGYEWGVKGADYYQGSRSYDYTLLSRDTHSTWQRMEAELEYSTVKDFLGGKSDLPWGISYEFSDTVAGTNIEHQRVHELGLKMYF